MDAPALSSYWVKFFKNAGFPTEHATRHALIFSNNRIKPDMLPDLDKPSLKEMGITLMGDMIAILRYAKKVVEETTCKKFLVSSEDSPTPVSKGIVKPMAKKVAAKTVVKTSALSKAKLEAPAKVVKTTASSVIKPVGSVAVKKKVSPSTIIHSKLYSDYIENNQKPKVSPLKRKYESDEDDSNGKWKRNEELQKRLRALSDDDDDEDDVEELKFKVLASKKTAVKSQKVLKKALEQKKTVFHRLGDSMVSSTTSSTESSNPTFKVTGIGKERSTTSSVFNRLGNKDNETPYSRHLRNGGIVNTATQGILKSRTPLLGTKVITTKNRGTTIITTKSAVKKPAGTMRADEEANKKAVSESVRQLVRTTKNLKFNESPVRSTVRSNSLPTRKLSITSKLASERIAVPAKSRLGVSKQVTFNKMASLNHVKKQGVFSRLGV